MQGRQMHVVNASEQISIVPSPTPFLLDLQLLYNPLSLPPSLTHLYPISPSSITTSYIMSAPANKFKVADISLAAFGRREIELYVHLAKNSSAQGTSAYSATAPRLRCPVS